MKIKETVSVEREIHVAPCIKCGSSNILITDSNYSSFNIGGGYCKDCNHNHTSGVGCNPSIDSLANIWNQGNDISLLVKVEEEKIIAAQKEIQRLKDIEVGLKKID